MRRLSVLLLLVGLMAVPSSAFADAQTINFNTLLAKCHQVFNLYGVGIFNPTIADQTHDWGLGVLDDAEFDLLEWIFANPTAPHHEDIHEAFKANQAQARTHLGATVIGMTQTTITIPGTTLKYAADGLVGAYVTMGEWTVYAWIMDTLGEDYVTWCFNDADPDNNNDVICTDFQVYYDMSNGPLLGACGDYDGDGVSNCKEYWASSNWNGARDAGVTTEGAAPWNIWACAGTPGSGASYKFSYNAANDRVYFKSFGPVLYESARALDVIEYPGGGNLGVSLVTIRNADENTFVFEFTGNGAERSWLGLNDTAVEGTWAWDSGAPVTYTNWRDGEPNNSGGTEDYAEMRSDGTWNDASEKYQQAIFESNNVYVDDDANGKPDAFEDVDPVDGVPDGFGEAMPTASFTADVTSGDMPLLVQFTDASTGNGLPITSRVWDFGDGSPTSTATNPSHTFMAQTEPSSTYTVTLTVTTDNGSDDFTMPITVNYVCEFDGALTSQGETLVAMMPVLSEGLAAILNGLGMPTWYDWDIENLPNYETQPVGDGFPDSASMALIEFVACAGWLDANAVTYAGMSTNKALFLEDVAWLVANASSDFAGLSLFADLFAGLIGSSAEMKATINGLFLVLTEGAVGLPQLAEYVVFDDGKAGELFSAGGDLDNDGKTNLEEWEEVTAAGGGMDAFLVAALNPGPFWPGNPALPVAGVVGLGLLAGSLLAGAALAIRKK